jgi:hypothetical protein
LRFAILGRLSPHVHNQFMRPAPSRKVREWAEYPFPNGDDAQRQQGMAANRQRQEGLKPAGKIFQLTQELND